MPVVEKLMDALVARYGKGKGESVYYAMEAEGSGPFGKGKKYRSLHVAFAAKNGVTPIGTKKKPAAPKKGRRARTVRR